MALARHLTLKSQPHPQPVKGGSWLLGLHFLIIHTLTRTHCILHVHQPLLLYSLNNNILQMLHQAVFAHECLFLLYYIIIIILLKNEWCWSKMGTHLLFKRRFPLLMFNAESQIDLDRQYRQPLHDDRQTDRLKQSHEGKTPPVQVAQCQDHLVHKYRSGMQRPNAGSTRARSALRRCFCASCIWLLHPAPTYTCFQDGLDTACATCDGEVFHPSTSENAPLALTVVITHCNLRWWCFLSINYIVKILHLHSW